MHYFVVLHSECTYKAIYYLKNGNVLFNLTIKVPVFVNIQEIESCYCIFLNVGKDT